MSITKKIWVLMGLNDKEFQARMSAVTDRLRRVQRESVRDARRLSITTQEMFYGMTLPMGLFAKTVIDATKRIESLHIGLATIAKSKGIGNIEDLIRSTTALAKLPGLGLEETFRGVKDLISIGFGAKEALRTIEGLGIGIARAGGSAEQFGRIMTQVTQALAKGKLEMQDFKTIFEQMPEARGILEKAFGPGMSDLEKLRNKGIGVNQVIQALVDGFKELGAAGHMDTVANKIENLSDNWLVFRATIGDKILKDQIHSVLDGLSKGLDKATTAINNMSPEMRGLISETIKWVGIAAVALPAATFLGKMFLLLKAQAAGLAAAFLRMNPYVAALAGSLIAIDQIGKRLIPNWRGLTGELKLMGQQIAALAATKFPAFTNTITSLFGIGQKKGFSRPGGGGLGFLKDFGKDANDAVKPLGKIIEKTYKLDEAIKKLSKTFMERGDFAAGFRSFDPAPNMSTQSMANILFANDRNNNFTTSKITDGLDAGAMKQQLMEIREGVALGKIAWDEYFKTLAEGAASLSNIKAIMSEIFAGPIADGVIAISDSFGVFMDAVLNGSEDAFGAMAKAMGNAVKQMIVDLIKLIAKMAIVAALWAIFAPAGAAKGLGGLNDFLGGSSGGGFLGSLLKGISGFADGGVVGGSSKYGDKILARVNSKELMLTERQQKSVYGQMSSGGSVRINGELMVRGRNLVYVLEETQVQLKSAR